MVYVLPSTATLAEPTLAPMLLTDSALPSTNIARDCTCGVASSVITTANACLPPEDPLPMSILPPCLTQVTAAGSKPPKGLPPTRTCAAPPPVETLDAGLLDAGLAVWPPLEQATSADAQPRVAI